MIRLSDKASCFYMTYEHPILGIITAYRYCYYFSTGLHFTHETMFATKTQ